MLPWAHRAEIAAGQGKAAKDHRDQDEDTDNREHGSVGLQPGSNIFGNGNEGRKLRAISPEYRIMFAG